MGNTQVQHPFPGFLAFSGGYNHACVGNCDADTGHQLGKGVVVNSIVKGIRINVIRPAYPGHADGMGSHPEHRLQVLRVHQKSRKFIPVKLQAKQHAASHIINTAQLCTVHCLCVVTVIMLRPCGMKLLIAFLVICLLEQNIGTDSRVLKLPVILHCGGRYVHVDAAYGSVFMLYTVNGVNGLQHVFNGIVHRVLPCFQGQALMSHILQRHNLPADFILCQLLPWDMLVLGVVGTVHTPVDAVIGQVQRRKQHDAVSVEILFNLLRQLINFLVLVLQSAVQKHHGLPVGQAPALSGLCQNLVDQLPVGAVCLPVGKGLLNFPVMDEFLRMG